jgi:hypothetical protein
MLARPAPPAIKAHKEISVPLALKVFRVRKAILALLAQLAPPAILVRLALLAPQVRKEFKAMQARLDPRVSRAFKESKVMLDLLALLGPLARLGMQARLVQLALFLPYLGLPAPLVLKASRGMQARPALKASKAFKVSRAMLARPGLQEILAPPAPLARLPLSPARLAPPDHRAQMVNHLASISIKQTPIRLAVCRPLDICIGITPRKFLPPLSRSVILSRVG